MPIYEYQCSACGALHEALQKVSDPPLADCPACGAKGALKKKVSAAAFRLKGGGWYETDFKSGKKKNIAGDEAAGKTGDGEKKAAGAKGDATDSASSAKGGDKKEGKSDAKPASKKGDTNSGAA
jgi:putative FmdB family regulatory protein